METNKNKSVLISGASFAGLSTAFWMHQLGYKVTVVEIAPALKKGGTPVNIMGNTIDIMKRMGLFEQVKANKITMQTMAFKNADDTTERLDYIQQQHEERGETEYEIERDVLLHMMFDAVKDKVEFIFGEQIVSINEKADAVEVAFKANRSRSFDLVFGCDGIHSAVRKYCFGEENEFSHFLKIYFSITIVHKLLIPENSIQMYNEPGKMIMLNAYNNKTDIVFNFFSENEIDYDYRNEKQQRDIISNQFKEMGWRAKELLEEVGKSETFYFDKLCQMKMPSWTKGRIALVGDAAYCASPAAGRGGSLAIDGAAALADAFYKCEDNYELAFEAYNANFRPFIEEVQADVINFGLEALLPKTEEAIRKRNIEGIGF